MHILIIVANGVFKDAELMQSLLSGLSVGYMTPSNSSSSAEKNKREKGKKPMNYAHLYTSTPPGNLHVAGVYKI